MQQFSFLNKKLVFFGMQQFSFNPAPFKIIINNKNNFLLFTKECHLISDKLESMEIESRGGLNFH